MPTYPRLSLPTVSAPEELQTALRRILDGIVSVYTCSDSVKSVAAFAAYPKKKLVADGGVLYRHLLSRKTLSRVQESRRRRGLLRVVPGIALPQWHGSPATVVVLLRYCNVT